MLIFLTVNGRLASVTWWMDDEQRSLPAKADEVSLAEQLDALEFRRAALVAHFDEQIARKGEGAAAHRATLGGQRLSTSDHAMKPLNGNAPLAWIAALGFFIAVSWPHLSATQLPFVGLRNLTAPHIGWPLTAVTVLMALFLSFPSLLSRDRLLICGGFSLCLYLVVTFYVSMVAPLLLLFIAVNTIREGRPNSRIVA